MKYNFREGFEVECVIDGRNHVLKIWDDGVYHCEQ